MPDMTEERVAAMAEAAQENDPQPAPLSDFAPAGTVRLTIYGPWLGSDDGAKAHQYFPSEDVVVEVAETGAIVAHAQGFVVGFAPGAWTRYELTSTEAGEGQ